MSSSQKEPTASGPAAKQAKQAKQPTPPRQAKQPTQPKQPKAPLPELLLPHAEAWRSWLETHHADSPGVQLVLGRKGGSLTALSYDGALQEALCFGWIDGQANRRDEESYFQRFTPRRPRSIWSRRNVGFVERLEEAGKMHPAGRAAVEQAKANGRWETAYAGSAAAEVPEDLLAAIAEVPAAQAMYEVLTSQNRYALFFRMNAVKTPATRERKIASLVRMLAEGKSPYPQRRAP
ncbi:YdeI/OmpD-associated family protein [Arthrobacter sp. zg-Y1219]|uniref:YdeI/OmpD-associated family protein n=1 Tax=Arthrobacter sp. zg-Y1219 TaxID=3049067 RepID=UPI0024C3D568|nr:YdeI/OmpD-associated family protein [Arthrobacter sp. zg-Y1219]MDK1361510.1 YdeI/OmpD-associated family protein [Arthrobacter sp. zg-Y1219]